eukprot:764780-Hanusia_phi.AAC.5
MRNESRLQGQDRDEAEGLAYHLAPALRDVGMTLSDLAPLVSNLMFGEEPEQASIDHVAREVFHPPAYQSMEQARARAQSEVLGDTGGERREQDPQQSYRGEGGTSSAGADNGRMEGEGMPAAGGGQNPTQPPPPPPPPTFNFRGGGFIPLQGGQGVRAADGRSGSVGQVLQLVNSLLGSVATRLNQRGNQVVDLLSSFSCSSTLPPLLLLFVFTLRYGSLLPFFPSPPPSSSLP